MIIGIQLENLRWMKEWSLVPVQWVSLEGLFSYKKQVLFSLRIVSFGELV